MKATSLQVAVVLLALIILPISTSGNSAWQRLRGEKRVVDYNVYISESGEKYTERIEVNRDKNTELFEVPAHPGVDRSDVLHDFNQNLTMLRIPDQNTCYLFPLMKEQTTPEKLIRDLDKASGMVVTETKRVDNTWILDGQLTDRTTLSEELAQFCAKYFIYQVKMTQDSLNVAKESRTIRRRRSRNMNRLCSGGMNLTTAFATCSGNPKFKCSVEGITCYKYVICTEVGKDGLWPLLKRETMSSQDNKYDTCHKEHISNAIVCCEYICQNKSSSAT